MSQGPSTAPTEPKGAAEQRLVMNRGLVVPPRGQRYRRLLSGAVMQLNPTLGADTK